MAVLRTAIAMPSTFLTESLDALLAGHTESAGAAGAAALAAAAIDKVPAYREFLRSHGVDPTAPRTDADFARLPLMTKPGYMQRYPLPARCWGGELSVFDRVAVSTGSTGRPTFWPRSAALEHDVAVRFEQVFRDGFDAHRRRTLAIVCFALGNWVGGIYTTSCLWLLAQKGYPITVATPGNKKDEIFRVVEELAPHFDQTVLLGYPPFVKDVLDAGKAAGVDWAAYNIRMVFAGEVFSEEWRALVCARAGGVDPCRSTASLYGTADGGVLGNETPLSIAIRRFFAAHPAAARELFGESRLPTLVQYDPVSRYFETYDNTLVVSGDGGVPLVRYHIADRGGLVGFDEMRARLSDFGAPLLEDFGFPADGSARPLPFVYVFGRADFTVSFYGANIYPENVTVGLEAPEFARWLTGKFVLQVPEAATGDTFLSLVVELAPGIDPAAVDVAGLAGSVQRELRRINSEFANYVPLERQWPTVTLRSFEDPEYFPAGVKHRYTRR
ncbi:phenylacetate--CoA ligase family protein [Methylolobus aquaticus]